jgi:zinc D-Ala-D-Ala dipeptidase
MNKYFAVCILATAAVFGCCLVTGQTKKSNSDIVDLRSIDSTFVLDIRYATKNNFTKKQLYPIAKAKLRREAAESLYAVNRDLKTHGVKLKIYDAYRPLSIQWKLWNAVPNPNFVADPRKGSRHNRGAAVDLTIVDSLGKELEMPTPYDDFSEKASPKYMKLPQNILRNRSLLRDAMMRHGFLPISSEWWHFDFRGWEQFDILDEPL